MDKIILVLALLFPISSYSEEKVKILSMQYNENVTINISNIPCPFKDLKQEYPFGVMAFRIDGQKLAGCYKPLDKDLLRIQWYKGDHTDLPYNAFLLNQNGEIKKPEPKADM